MKRFFAALLALLLASFAPALGEEAQSVTLEGDHEQFTVEIPAVFYKQWVEPVNKGRGSNYVFEAPDLGCRFVAYMAWDTDRDQQSLLRKLREQKNGGAVVENVLLGDEAYLVSRSQGVNQLWSFLMLAGNGYSYRFWYELPGDQAQEEMPETTVAILRSLRRVREEPKREFAPIPVFRPEDYPPLLPIDAENRETAEEQMIASAKALLSAPGLNLPMSDAMPRVNWTPPDFYANGQWPWGGPVYAVGIDPKGSELPRQLDTSERYTVIYRPDGTLRLLYIPIRGTSDWSRKYIDFLPGDVLYIKEWWASLTEYLTAFAYAVDPDHAPLLDRFLVDEERQWADMCILEIQCQSDDPEQDMPHFTVEVSPEFRILTYGIGVG